MATEDILLSPSGNVIGQIGAGALIRMAEGQREGSQSVTLAEAEILAVEGVGLRVSLANPKANLDYRAECEFDINNGTSQVKADTVQLDVSYDAGATWNQIGTDTLLATVGPSGTTHVHARSVLGALPNFPAVAPAAALLRCTIQQTSGDDATTTIQKAYMSFEEHKRS